MKIRLHFAAILAALPLAGFAQIPNASLDDWQVIGSSSEEKPVSWDTPDVIAVSIGVSDPVVTQENANVQDGDAAARLESKTLNVLGSPLNVPGTITLGTLGFDFATFTPSLTGGIPFTQRPTSMTFYYQYAPAGGDGMDTANFAITFSKAHTPIGGGTFRTSNTDGAYAMGEATINFGTSDDPDTMNIVITSSGGFTSVVPGSVLFVDNIALTGLASIQELPAGIGANIYPNPANSVINIKNPLTNTVQYVATNLQGEKMDVITMTPGLNAIDVSKYASGLYIFTLVDNGANLYQGRFEVMR